MSQPLEITPRNLGSIRLPSYCPACFKFLLGMKFKPPFNHFGAAIFGDAQRCQEAVIGYFLQRDCALPEVFKPFCDCSERVEYNSHWSKFRFTESESGVVLYGSPDEILRRKDGSLCVIDHKTAHKKGDKDVFLPQYETQVVGYSRIAEGMGLGTVTQGGLLYWEAQVQDVLSDPAKHFDFSLLTIPFAPSTHEFKIDYALLSPLLAEAKKVWNARELPEGRTGCDDCKKRDILLALDHTFTLHDRRMAQEYADAPSLRQKYATRLQMRPAERRTLLEAYISGQEMFCNDGVIANWEYV